MSDQLLSKCRSLVQQYTAKHLYSTALYWADKALSLSAGDPNDLATCVQTLYHLREYQRASHMLHSSNLLTQSPSLRYLAARCHAACEEWETVISLLIPPDDPLPDHTPPTALPSADIAILSLGNIESSSLVLRAIAHEGLGDLLSAVDCYKQALMCDVYCEEALDRLCEHHALTEDEERSLINAMPFKSQCSLLEENMLRFLYIQKLQHSKKTSAQPPLTVELQSLSTNIDVLCTKADHYFQHLNVDSCYKLTSDILSKDPYHRHTILLHVACCVQKKKFEELFSLGHRLVNSFPSSALSWYVVGCYYIVINKHQNARKFLTKSVSLEPNFGYAHMAFGLSFSAEREHDQAIAAFSNAARTMRGSHLALLYLGKEYHYTGAVTTSTRFMKSAFDFAPKDPCLLQEIGFIVASIGGYPKAERYFKQAVAQLQLVDPHMTLQAWEPVYNNLGHVLRKQHKYDESLNAHLNALQLEPSNSSTLTAIAFVYLLKGDYEAVVEYANQSLRLKREDQFTLEVLHTAMEEMSEVPLVKASPSPDIDQPELRMVLKSHPKDDSETEMSTD